MFSFPSFGFKLFVVSVLLVSNLLVVSVSSFSVSGTEIFSWIEFRIYVFQAVVYGTVFNNPGGSTRALSLGYSFAFSYLLRKPRQSGVKRPKLKIQRLVCWEREKN